MNPFESESPPPIAPGLQVEEQPGRPLRPLWLVPLLVLVVGSATLLAWLPRSSPAPIVSAPSLALQRSPSPSAQPTLTWSADHVDVILSPGDTASRSLTLTTTRTVGGLRFCLSPALLPFLQVHVLDKNTDDEKDLDQNEANDPNNAGCNKDHFQLKTGGSRSVELIFTVPTGATLGTDKGMVEIHHGSQTLSQTMRVTVNAWQRFVDNTLGVSFKYPPDWSPVVASGNQAADGDSFCDGPGDGPNAFSLLQHSLPAFDEQILLALPGLIRVAINAIRLPPSGQIALCQSEGVVFDANAEKASFSATSDSNLNGLSLSDTLPAFRFFDAADELDPLEPVYIARSYILYKDPYRLEVLALSSLDTSSLTAAGCVWSKTSSRESCAQPFFSGNPNGSQLRNAFDQVFRLVETLNLP